MSYVNDTVYGLNNPFRKQWIYILALADRMLFLFNYFAYFFYSICVSPLQQTWTPVKVAKIFCKLAIC